ncbi:MAG TPA: hypothetical protein VF749_16125 [Candidatus Acidoferrum sp.]
MNAEPQNEQPVRQEIAPETAPVGESKQSKRGGRRPGTGRKPNLSRRLLKGFSREAIAEAIAGMDCGQVITSLLKSKRERTRLETPIFVRDTLIGRPAQHVQVSALLHGHTAWRPLARPSDDEVALLDTITKNPRRQSQTLCQMARKIK